MTVCSFPECGRGAKSKGFCSGHYQQSRSGELKPLWQEAHRQPQPCGFNGCGRTLSSRGLCDGHYQQLRDGKELAPLRVRHLTCTFPECTNPHEARGLCDGHYRQVRYQQPTRPLITTSSPIDAEGRVTLYGERDRAKGHIVGFAQIDPDSIPLATPYRWRRNLDGYAATKIDGKSVLMHRMLTPEAGVGIEVDHIDGDRLNNRRENLRVVTKKEQAQNRGVRSDNQTGHRNVSFDKSHGRYRVIVTTPDGRRLGHRHALLGDALAEATALRKEHLPYAVEARSTRRCAD